MKFILRELLDNEELCEELCKELYKEKFNIIIIYFNEL